MTQASNTNALNPELVRQILDEKTPKTRVQCLYVAGSGIGHYINVCVLFQREGRFAIRRFGPPATDWRSAGVGRARLVKFPRME